MLKLQGLEGSQGHPKLNTAQHHLHAQAHSQEEFTPENVKVIAMTMCYIKEMNINKEAFQFVQSYSLTKGLK